ncbi:MAG: ATP-dependent DNA helicase RecG [Phycisphaerales bacterium JB037]
MTESGEPSQGPANRPDADGAPETPIELTTLLADLPGFPRPLARQMASLGLWRLAHLVLHLPMRYEHLEAEAPIGEIEPDRIVSARGEITSTRPSGSRQRPRFEAILHDGEDRLELVWFHMPYIAKKLHVGDRVRVQGKAKPRGPARQMINPTFEILDDDEPPLREARLRPVYPASESVASRQVERAASLALPFALPLLDDHLPEEFVRAREMPALAEAYRMMHAPASDAEAEEARRRLAFDELLMLQLGVYLKRAHRRRDLSAPALEATAQIDEHIRARLPFSLTPAQDKVVGEVTRDLAQTVPTNRLIQGDVGSGKTVIALYAMLLAVAGGHQAALMAPTEILAEQHHASISEMLKGSRVRVKLLTGATPEPEAASILRALEQGNIDLLIGTHALLTERVRFRSLAVAIIDEQHRFGVHQRATLRAKSDDAGSSPHVLVMTATPIPRTLAITLFGDLDVSTITGLPPGRKPIVTRVVAPDERDAVYRFVRERVEAGDQAFVVVPTIEGSDDMAGVRSLVKELEEGPLAGKRVAGLHGKLKRATREHTMSRFRSGLIDVLVATTVIEVGVDVPNATVMVVEHAERFGLAQLHQLRGRVGRGAKPGTCLVIAHPTTEDAQRRMEVFGQVADGFKLAEKDLEIRGPGELFGTRQSGLPPLRIADLMGDRELLGLARRDAAAWIERSPRLDQPAEALLRRRLLKAYGETLGLGDIG